LDNSTSKAADESGRRNEGLPNDVGEGRQRVGDVDDSHENLRKLVATFERERALFGYEVHDGVVQYLVSAIMTQDDALQLLETHSFDLAREEFTRVLSLLQAAFDEARRMSNGLRPGALEQLGLIAAIRQLVTESQERYGVECAFAADVQFTRLAEPIETSIFRIAQEALSNALRHSGSRTVLVTLSQRGHWLCLKVEDWGTGSDPKRGGKKGIGLEGIRRRAELFEGRVKIRSAPGKGTIIKVWLPVVEREHAEKE
jgi:signal transduction histidine kinase